MRTYEDDVGDDEAQIGRDHANARKFLEAWAVRRQGDLLVRRAFRLVGAHRHQVAREDGKARARQNAEGAENVAVLVVGKRDGQRARAQADDHEREDRRVHRAFAHLELNVAAGRPHDS